MKDILTLFFLLISSFGFSQTQSEIDTLLNELSYISNSKEIRNSKQAKKIKSFGEKVIPILASNFADKTETKIYSDCNNRNLTKADLSIILSDYVLNLLPYFQLTGIQNCILTYCDKNPNLVEYYLNSIKEKEYIDFQNEFNKWILSDDYKKWIKFSKRIKEK